MERKKIMIILMAFIFLLGGFLFWLFKPTFWDSQKKTGQTDVSPKKTVLINTLPLEQRPYIILEPKSSVEPQSLGHWVTMTIAEAKDFERVEYEFEYTTGTIIQGGMGRINFNQEPPPVSKEIAFGSASKGKYKYDEGVNKGQFIFRFFRGEEETVLKTDFVLQTKAENLGIFRTADDKARLEVSGSDLKNNDYLIIASTLGLPEIPPGKIAAGPFGFYADSFRKLIASKLIFEDITPGEVAILGWNGREWQEYETSIDNNEVSAEIDRLGTFVLIE